MVLAVPAALAGGLAVWLMAGLGARNGTLPRWIAGVGWGVGVAQLFAFYTLPMVLLPLWRLIAAFGMRSSSAGQGPQPSDP